MSALVDGLRVIAEAHREGRLVPMLVRAGFRVRYAGCWYEDHDPGDEHIEKRARAK